MNSPNYNIVGPMFKIHLQLIISNLSEKLYLYLQRCLEKQFMKETRNNLLNLNKISSDVS
jgi:hypothetical protein